MVGLSCEPDWGFTEEPSVWRGEAGFQVFALAWHSLVYWFSCLSDLGPAQCCAFKSQAWRAQCLSHFLECWPDLFETRINIWSDALIAFGRRLWVSRLPTVCCDSWRSSHQVVLPAETCSWRTPGSHGRAPLLPLLLGGVTTSPHQPCVVGAWHLLLQEVLWLWAEHGDRHVWHSGTHWFAAVFGFPGACCFGISDNVPLGCMDCWFS